MTQSDNPSNPQEWLRHARSNLRIAEQGPRLKGVLLEDLCFNAQQAAEKALKAVCVQRGIDFPKTHSLVRLMDILESDGFPLPADIQEADILTQYAVQARYPTWDEAVTAEEYRDALQLAARVLFWAEKVIG
jgi:HEPN domain-containing protein